MLGDKEVTQLHALLSVCEKSDRGAVTSGHEQALRELASVVAIDAHLLLVWCLCTGELAMKLKHYASAE